MDLTQEGTQRYQRGEEAVAGFDTFLTKNIDDVLDRQHGAERERAILQEHYLVLLLLRW